MNIIVKTIPQSSQVYETSGDWRFDDEGNMLIFVSDMNDWKMEALIAVHEIVEALLCKDRGISLESVDTFDIGFEELRKSLPQLIGDMEPGDMTSAPYYQEHQFATLIEKALAGQLNIDYVDYTNKVNELYGKE